MPFQLPPLPNFNVQIPDLTQKAAEGAQLKAMLSEQALRQQLAPLQVQQEQQNVQAAQTKNVLAQMQLDSNKKMMEFMAAGGLDKFVGKNSNAPEGSAFDATGATAELARQGIMLEVAQPFIQHFQNIDKTTSEIAKNYGAAAGDFLNNRAKAHGQLAGSLDDALRSENPAGVIPSIIARFLKDPQGLSQEEIAGLKSLQGLSGDALVKTTGLMSSALNLGAEMDRHHAETAKAAAEATTAGQKVINPATGMSQEATEQAQKEVAVAQATQPLKIQTAMAEAKAKQLLEGLTRPGYAFDPASGQTRLTDQTQYLQSGGKLMGFRPITEKDVRDDTMLTNRLGDVHQKLSEYEQALQKPITAKEKSDIAGMLGEGAKGGAAAKVGFLGVGAMIPMDRLNAFMDSASLAELSPNARDQLVAYRNMREAMIGYKTVLSGSARGSDKQLELIENMIPSPAVTDADYSQRSINSFRGNLNVVGQGLPTLPGIKSPADWEAEHRQQRFSQPQQSEVLKGMGFISPTGETSTAAPPQAKTNPFAQFGGKPRQ